MLVDFIRNTRCSADVAASLSEVLMAPVLEAAPQAALTALGVQLPDDPAQILDFLRLERFQEQIAGAATAPDSGSLIRRAYYLLRPLLSVAVRKRLQRIALRGWGEVPFPRWPVETAVQDMEAAVWSELMRTHGVEKLPFIWFWPEGCRMASILTHDIETADGRDFCAELMGMESEFNLVSSFQVVPEERYDVSPEFLQSLCDGGCEVALHGLNHDGHLFDNEEEFRVRAEKINHYLRAWDAQGFRSPVMYRRLEWLHYLDIDYDMSVPNSARLDPQRGGCCTVHPYFVENVLELPLTTIQDYTLLAILNDATPDIWWRQMEIISAKGGLASFIVHPDYMLDHRGQQLYQQLLVRLAELRDGGQTWVALPRDLNEWWRQRDEMELVKGADGWTIQGVGADRARIAWAVTNDAGIQYEIES